MQKTEIDGLFEVRVSVFRPESEEEVLEVSTLLFDPPLLEEERIEREKERQKRRGRE